jgi:isoleucyl-tRNA synthetase
MSKYKEFSGLNLPSIEKEILAKWDETNAFQQSIDLKEGATPFVFYEGPPSANGMPGIHHVISRTLKDLVCRYNYTVIPIIIKTFQTITQFYLMKEYPWSWLDF